MPTISDQTIEEIRSRTDIVQVIGERVPLKRAGAAWKACCPFHHEKTPSFHVNPQRQRYHCFGCGEDGDVFKFLVQHDGMTFLDAVRHLAEKCGVEIVEQDDGGRNARARRLYQVNAEAAAFFHRCLLQTAAAAPARAYLEKRSLGPDVVELFELGYDPEAWGTLDKFAEAHGFTKREMAEAGLGLLPDGAQSASLLRDRFHGRLMFPVKDHQGRVVAFSGRVLDKAASPAKYVNSPETDIFKKARVLYALDKAQRAIANAPHREAIVCEGQIDVIRCHACGFPRAVASEGTAFTDEHAKLLHRYADSAVLLFDADGAGRKAAIRTAAILLAEGLPVRIARMPDGEDPDSFLLSHSKEDFQAILDAAVGPVPFHVEFLREQERDPDAADAAGRIVQGALQTVASCASPVHKARMAQELAQLLRLPEDAIRAELAGVEEALRRQREGAAFRREVAPPSPPPPPPLAPPPPDMPPPELFEDPRDAAPAPAPGAPAAPAEPSEPPPDPTDVALCEFLLKHGEEHPATVRALAALLPPMLFPNAMVRALVEAFYAATAGDGGEDPLERARREHPKADAFLGVLSARRDPTADHPPRDFVHQVLLDAWRRWTAAQLARHAREDGPDAFRRRQTLRRAQLDLRDWRLGCARVHELAGVPLPEPGADEFPDLPALAFEEPPERPPAPYIRHKPSEAAPEAPAPDEDEPSAPPPGSYIRHRPPEAPAPAEPPPEPEPPADDYDDPPPDDL